MSTGTKRGPGRPPRKADNIIPCNGIVSNPIDTDNLIELNYYEPNDFKQLFILLKNLKCQTIYFIFAKKYFSIISNDPNGDAIECKVDCSKIMHYYCKPDYICLSTDRSLVQSIFTNISKTINPINISYDTEDAMLYFKYENTAMGKTETRGVLVNKREVPEPLLDSIRLINETPVLKFCLPIRDLKDTIADVICYADNFNIVKHGTGTLILSFSKIHTNTCETEYTNPSLIDLENNLDENESFNTQINTSTLKSLSISVTNNKVIIKCYDNNLTVLNSNINDIITFNIITKI